MWVGVGVGVGVEVGVVLAVAVAVGEGVNINAADTGVSFGRNQTNVTPTRMINKPRMAQKLDFVAPPVEEI